MKIAIVVALLSIIVSASVLAADSSDTPSTKKTAPATPLVNKHTHSMAVSKYECSDEHGMGKHYEHGMMGDQSIEMMVEPNMHMLWALALSKEQQSKISKLADDLKHNNWATQGLINDATAKLRDLYEADKRDPATIGKEYQKIFDLKRQMIEAYLDTQNRIEEILTSEQFAKLRDARREMHHMQ